jgi:hypothetical protein
MISLYNFNYIEKFMIDLIFKRSALKLIHHLNLLCFFESALIFIIKKCIKSYFTLHELNHC